MPLPDSCAKKDLLHQLALVTIERSQSAIAAIVIKRFKTSGEAAFHPKLPAFLFAERRNLNVAVFIDPIAPNLLRASAQTLAPAPPGELWQTP